MNRYFLLLFVLLCFASSCGEKSTGGEEEPQPVNFDRRAMLSKWANEVIAPAHTSFKEDLEALTSDVEALVATPTATELAEVKRQFLVTYERWQRSSPFVIGKAEEVRLRERVNTYPTDTDLIQANIDNPDQVNLELPSQTTAQGLPALDYLLFGLPEATLLEEEAYRQYALELVTTMQGLIVEVLEDWQTFKDVYIQNDGNSATASIDRTVNDYIFHYEKFLRAGKVGIPAGVFSDTPLADRVEARYSGHSKRLFEQSLQQSEQFFSGSQSIADYLDALNVMRDGEPLSQKIKDQFAVIKNTAAPLNDDFASQVTEDNTQMLRLYDEMQKLVVLLKVDMLQALSINVDYVDADGD